MAGKRTARRRLPRGFTLAEALLASSILAAGAVSLTVPFASGARNEQADAKQTLAVALAQEMMDEILGRRFKDSEANAVFGPEPGETRAQYDSYDDYNGYTEANGNIYNFKGVRCGDPLAADLTRTVSVSYVHVPGQAAADPYTYVLVTVTIRQSQGASGSSVKTVVSLPRLIYFVP